MVSFLRESHNGSLQFSCSTDFKVNDLPVTYKFNAEKSCQTGNSPAPGEDFGFCSTVGGENLLAGCGPKYPGVSMTLSHFSRVRDQKGIHQPQGWEF